MAFTYENDDDQFCPDDVFSAFRDDRDGDPIVDSIQSDKIEPTAATSEHVRRPIAVLRKFSDIRPENLRWLWRNRIASGKLTLIVGDPGLGKSLLTADIAARVSTGKPWPDGQSQQRAGGVVFLCAEDDPADTVRPRLDAAGADVERITTFEAVNRYDPESNMCTERPVSLQTDLDALKDAIERTPDCRLVIIDPLNAFIGGGRLDTHKDADVRSVLTPITKLSQEFDVSIVAVSHLNKSSASAAIYRTNGSIGFTGAARAVWLMARDPNDMDENPRRVLLPVKCNLGPDSGGLAFKVVTGFSRQPVLHWEADPVKMSADEALTPRQAGRSKRESPQLVEAKEWLSAYLSEKPKPAAEVKAAAESDGIAKATLDRAKSALEIVARREGFGAEGVWVWSLPKPDPADVSDEVLWDTDDAM